VHKVCDVVTKGWLSFCICAIAIAASAQTVPSSHPGQTADQLVAAIRAHDLSAMRRAIESGANVNGISGDDSPLGAAIEAGDSEALRLLLTKGANPNLVTGKGTPLWLADSQAITASITALPTSRPSSSVFERALPITSQCVDNYRRHELGGQTCFE
jgi:hypothetical protein